MMNQTIAACVVTYNRKDLLVKCLKAILQQEYLPDGIIIVDNVSTDSTFEEITTVVFPDLQLEERFYFHDATSQILTVYHQADALCLPSVREGFPNVICEAMACGLPILCSHVGDNPRIVADTSSGWIFDPYTVDSISDALLSFLRTTPEQREEIARKNRNDALKRFSSRTFTEQYLHLLDIHAQTS